MRPLLLLLFCAPLLLPGQGVRRNIALGFSHGGDSGVYVANVGLMGNIYRLAGVQVNVVGSYVDSAMTGANVGGLLALTRGTVRGVQLGGLLTATSGEAHGVQLGGLANFNRGNVVGGQLAGAVNAAGGCVRGLQLAGVSNLTTRLHGVQFAGFSNIVSGEMRGVQLTGVANVAVRVRGVQITPLMNVSQDEMRGLQIGAINSANRLSGSQIGLLNICNRHPRGWQIGLVNYSRDTIAHKVGLVNVNPKTRVQLMAFLGTASKFNFAVRFRNRSTYNILGFATHYMGLDKDFSGTFFYRIGQYFHLRPKWTISGDAGFFHVESSANGDASSTRRLYSLQGRVNLDYQLTPKLGFFVSTGYEYAAYYAHHRHYKTRPLLELGVTLF